MLNLSNSELVEHYKRLSDYEYGRSVELHQYSLECSHRAEICGDKEAAGFWREDADSAAEGAVEALRLSKQWEEVVREFS